MVKIRGKGVGVPHGTERRMSEIVEQRGCGTAEKEHNNVSLVETNSQPDSEKASYRHLC